MATVNSSLVEICNEISRSIQNKLKTTTKFRVIDFADKIDAIAMDANATSDDVRENKIVYVKDKYIRGTFIGEDLVVEVTKEGKTYTAPSNRYYRSCRVPAEPNLLPENIRKGVSIFGVEGTLSYLALLRPFIHLESAVYSSALFKTVDDQIFASSINQIFYVRGD